MYLWPTIPSSSAIPPSRCCSLSFPRSLLQQLAPIDFCHSRGRTHWNFYWLLFSFIIIGDLTSVGLHHLRPSPDVPWFENQMSYRKNSNKFQDSILLSVLLIESELSMIRFYKATQLLLGIHSDIQSVNRVWIVFLSPPAIRFIIYVH